MKKIVFAISSVLLALTFASCKKPAAKAAAADPADNKEATVYAVNAQLVHRGTLDDYLQFGGNVTAASTVAVMPKASGKIHSQNVQVGSKVTKGQHIMWVDPSQPGMVYALSPVDAPISGVVTALPYQTGATVSPATPVASIATTNQLEIDIFVPERFVARVQMGQRADITLDAYPGQTFGATVVQVAPQLDLSSRTMEVKLSVNENPNDEVKIGMFARVKLITDERQNVIIIPANAAVIQQGKEYVFVCDKANSIAHKIAIQPGITVDNMMEVRQGLQDGDEVVVSGQSLLSEGSKINILSTSDNSNAATGGNQ